LHKGFYRKLALTNLMKNKQIYFPYLITCICTIAMFYIMRFISTNEKLTQMSGGEQLSIILKFGSVVIAIFAAIFLIYSNSFLMKRRKKELGLYNVLGLGKWNLALMLFHENCIVMFSTTGIGIIFGVAASKLMLLLLLKIVRTPAWLGFSVSMSSITSTVALFVPLFLLILCYNFLQVRAVNPIDLLHGSSQGEKEPKSKWLIAVPSFLALAGGYFIAIWVESPMDAVWSFLLAVLLVIFGTYGLFTAGSIVFLKFLRKRKNYYYKTKHFITISGMLYRMKQNAVGLGNICILSTMVLVMISGTVSLYVGQDDLLKSMYPFGIQLVSRTGSYEVQKELEEIADSALKDAGITDARVESCLYYALTSSYEEGKLVVEGKDDSEDCIVYFVTAAQHEALTGEALVLSDSEAGVWQNGREPDFQTLGIYGTEFSTVPVISAGLKTLEENDIYDTMYVVVASDDVLNKLYETINASEIGVENYTASVGIDSNADAASLDKLYQVLSEKTAEIENVMTISRSVNKADFLVTYGGLFFVGIFLGSLFLMATVMIIYYKQIFEGHEDKERFKIMQNVGLSRKEIRTTIRSQVLLVFFLPLFTAVIHIAFAFKVITKLLLLLSLTNVSLFLTCTLITIAVFTVIYILVYSLTARSYYKIVQ